MGVYFHTDTTRLTFAELWRISSRLPVFLAGCRNKILGIRRPPRFAVYHEESVLIVPAEDVSPAAQRFLHPRVEAFEHHGAQLLFYQTVPSSSNLSGFGATLLPPEHNAIATVTWASTRPGKESGGCVVTSHMDDGRFFFTSNHRARFNSPPLYVVQRHLHAAPDELLDLHQEGLARSAAAAMPVENAEQAIQVIVEAKRANFAWHVSRGVWVPLTQEELAALDLPESGEP